MDLDSFRLILFLVVLLFSVYSVVSYSLRRAGNRRAFQQLKSNGRPLRTLTPEERMGLQPFLVNPAKPSQRAKLGGDEVYELDGEFSRHGLSAQGSNTMQMHDTIGGVDVVLPYDAQDFLLPQNHAEVALTSRFAVVVRLNDTFDLAGGHERATQAQKRNEQGSAGATEHGAPETPTKPSAASAELLGQRDETPAEAEWRTHSGWGALIPALLLAGALGALLLAGYQGNAAAWLLVSAVLLALMIWHEARRRAPAAPKKINRMRATLRVISLRDRNNTSVVRAQAFLGNDLPVALPSHWPRPAIARGDEPLEVDVRDEDGVVVRVGARYSIDAEHHRFPPAYWRPNVLLAFVAAVGFGAAWALDDDVAADFAHAKAGLLAGSASVLDDAVAARSDPPPLGSLVELRARGRCQIGAPSPDTFGSIDCRSVRWGADAPRIGDVTVSKDVLELSRGWKPSTHRNAMLDLMLQAQLARQMADQVNPLVAIPSVLVVEGVTDLIERVERLCKGIDERGAGICERLRKHVGESFVVGGDDEPADWAKLAERVRSREPRSSDDVAIVERSAFDTVSEDLGSLGHYLERRAYQAPLEAALASQRGGVLLLLSLADAQALRPSWLHYDAAGEDTDSTAAALAAGAMDALAVPDTGDSSEELSPGEAAWRAYRTLASPLGVVSVELSGIVVGNGTDEHGDRVFAVDTTRTQSNYLAPLLHVLAIVLGAVLALVNGALFVARVSNAKKRTRAIAAQYGAADR